MATTACIIEILAMENHHLNEINHHNSSMNGPLSKAMLNEHMVKWRILVPLMGKPMADPQSHGWNNFKAPFANDLDPPKYLVKMVIWAKLVAETYGFLGK